jgi:hypothetical protein
MPAVGSGNNIDLTMRLDRGPDKQISYNIGCWKV